MRDERTPELGTGPFDDRIKIKPPEIAAMPYYDNVDDYIERDPEEIFQEQLDRNKAAELNFVQAIKELREAGYDERSIRFFLRKEGFGEIKDLDSDKAPYERFVHKNDPDTRTN